MKAILFDTETTALTLPGVAPLAEQPFIIELGAIVVDERGMALRELSQLLYPGKAINEEITKITGIKNEDLQDKPTFKEFLPQLRSFFDGTQLLICHNAPFDVAMLRFELERAACQDFPWPKDIVCTAQEYAHVLGERPRLIHLYETILGRELKQTHRALDDVHAMLEIIQHDNFLEKIGAV